MMSVPAAELGELKAFTNLYEAAPPGLGARVEQIGGATCLALPAVPSSAMFNRALGRGLKQPSTETDVEQVVRFHGELGVEWCAALAPQAKPAEIEGKPSSSYRNILRAGFELDYVRPNYVSSSAADTRRA